ncbi:hypothetical protein [Acidovorax sp. Root568]|uniref:hypothetical protein n=1 Tax=Acidovorax sp. Root568 TaxID=1736565 RepID=UPI000A5FF564|nr:hypothetical protein [Acidovorax sp. Root568]
MNKAFICNHCSSPFTPSRSDQKYCNRNCKNKQQAASRKTRTKTISKSEKLKKKLTAFQRSSFGRWLISTIKSQGTVQILQGMNAADLQELFDLKKAATSFSGFEKGAPSRAYHLSHIFSAKGNQHSIGLLKSTNLVICPAGYNFSRLNCEEAVDGRGDCLPRSALRSVYKCDKNTPPSKIIQLIKRLLGNQFETFLLNNKFTPGIHAKLLDEVRKYSPSIDESTDIETLKAMKSRLGKQVHVPRGKPAPLVLVLEHELRRFELHNGPVFWAIYQIAGRLLGRNNIIRLRTDGIEGQLQRLFLHALDLLHQKRHPSFSAERYVLDVFSHPARDDFPLDLQTVLSPLDTYFACESMNVTPIHCQSRLIELSRWNNTKSIYSHQNVAPGLNNYQTNTQTQTHSRI